MSAEPALRPAAASAAERPVFAPRTVIAIVAAGIVGLAMFLVLVAYASELRGSGGDGRAHALSNSAVGYRALVRLIELGGGLAWTIRDPIEHDTEDLLVVTPDERTEPAALQALLAARMARPTLIILPKWEVMPDPGHSGWVRRLGPRSTDAIERMFGEDADVSIGQRRAPAPTATGVNALDAYAATAPEPVQTIAGKNLTPVVTAGDGAVLVARLGEGPLFVASDPDLFNNQGLRDEGTARAALVLLDELNLNGAGAVAFDLTLSGYADEPHPLKLAFDPPFLALTLVLVAAAILAGLHGAARFGAPAEEAPALAFGKSALVENSASLFKIAKREHRAGGAYAELVREAAAHDSGAHLALRDSELDAYLDRISPGGRPNFSALSEQARSAGSRSDLVAAARALFQWKKDLIK